MMSTHDKQREFEFTWDDFNFLRKLSSEYSGILVPDEKFDMFYSRLSKRIRVLGLSDFKSYSNFLKNNHEAEFTEFINAITTNLTSFFREKHHFEFLKDKLIPELIKKNQSTKVIKAWSAGCSTGEEPYSIVMTLLENLPSNWEVKLLATDLDTKVLETAANGIYSRETVTNISEARLKRWFHNGKGAQINKVKVKAELQACIRFRQLNLMQEWPMQQPFDFIFCRNVFIYFDRETKCTIAQRYSSLLPMDAYLFIGHSETIQHGNTDFELLGHTIYKKVSKRV